MRNWHQQEHQDLGGVTYSDTSNNSKTWLVTQQNGTRASRRGLCHNKWTPARCKNTKHNTLPAARIPRLELCHKTLASARTPRLELSQLHSDSSKNTKTRAVSPTLTPVTTARLGLCHLHWHQKQHQDSGFVTKHWHQQEHKTRAVSPTLTSVRTARLGLCHLHWHQ